MVVSQAHTPKKSKTRLKGVVIQETKGDGQLQGKRKAIRVLKAFSSKRLATKPFPRRIKRMVF